MTDTTAALATVNGRPVTSVAYAHKLWSDYLDLQDRFETGAGLASHATRNRLDAKAAELAQRAGESFRRATEQGADESARFIARKVLNQLVRLETELGKLSADAPLSESFHVRKASNGGDAELSGSSAELSESAAEALAEASRLRFKLHAIRKSTANRVELSKAGLVSRFSWSDAWAEAKAQMRELGAEIRQHEGWAAAVSRELNRREFLAELQTDGDFGPYRTLGATPSGSCDPDYDLPELGPNLDSAEWELMFAEARGRF